MAQYDNPRFWRPSNRPRIYCDTECYPNFWSIGFKRKSDGKRLVFEHSWRKPITEEERARIRAIILKSTIVTYNGMGYDMPMIWLMLSGATPEQLKQANDRIILGKMKYWEVERAFDIVIPQSDHIDLIEPQPNAFASLKKLASRLHGKQLQDLPYSPDTELTDEEADITLSYMGNDIDNTELVDDWLQSAMSLRNELSEQYDMDLRSKSDSQIGEAIIKKRAEQITGRRIKRIDTPAGSTFKYPVPDWIEFKTPALQQFVDRLRRTDFVVQPTGKVLLPTYMDDLTFTIGSSTYALGIGGLHSTESNRAVHADEDHDLVDVDVASYYPAIIINSRMFPESIGQVFTEVFTGIRDERVAAKREAKRLKREKKGVNDPDRIAEIEQLLAALSTVDKSLKICLNGTFGKTGSKYSILYAPHLMIFVTLTGQLALLMLIEMMEDLGVTVVSGNTDGLMLKIPKHLSAPISYEGEVPMFEPCPVLDVLNDWMGRTGFSLEATPMLSIYNASVNSYYAVQADGSIKMKGAVADAWVDRDNIRDIMMKSRRMSVTTRAIVNLLKDNTPIEETIMGCTDIRDFLTGIEVQGGGKWREQYLGKVARYYWSIDGDEILYSKPNDHGTYKKVSKSDGAVPMMRLPDDLTALPADLDYDRYIAETKEILMDIGFDRRPDPIKPVRLYKYNMMLWFALAV